MLLAFLLFLWFGDWPQFLGPSRNGVSGEEIAPWKTAPPVAWKVRVGQGFAAPVVAGGKVLVFHREGDEEVLSALDPATGKPIWRAAVGTNYKDDFGFDEGPRAAPVVDADRVFVYGAEGSLRAHDLSSGKLLWRVDVMKTYAVEKGFFGAAGAPLVAGGRVMINAGGRTAGVVAFDVATGKELWRASDDAASYSSAVMAVLNGKPAAVFFTRNGLLVLNPADGSVLHQSRWRSRSNASVNAATPLVDGNRIFLSASYGTGAMLVDAASWKPVWSGDESLSNHYATSVKTGDLLCGFHGRQEMGPELRCVEWATGSVRWSEGGLGAGVLIAVGSRLLALTERGELILFSASPNGFQPLAGAAIVPGTVRAYPALAHRRLYVRNENTLYCLRLE
jgi:outer membrane protein assembly factor BamB